MNSTVEEVKPVEPILEWSELSLQHSSVTDSELLEIYRCSRSQAALTEIIRRHSPLVSSVTRRLISNRQDAEDAFQATFLVLVLSVKKIRNPESLGAWLYGVAFRTSKRLRSLRRKANLKAVLESHVGVDLDATQSSDEEPLSIISREMQLEAMDEELSRLPKSLRETLVEHYLSGNSVPEIARCLNLSVSAVEGRLKRGRKALRMRLAMRGVSLSLVAAACIRFQQDVVAASAEPWSNRLVELLGNAAGAGTPSLAKLIETKAISEHISQLIQGELIVKSLSRSLYGLVGGLLVLGVLGTIGFVSALANQQLPSADTLRVLVASDSEHIDEAETFVLSQVGMGGMGGMGGGGMGGMGVGGGGIMPGINAPKEVVIKWEKHPGPPPAWLDSKLNDNEKEAEIRKKLGMRLDVEFNAMPLSGVVAFMRKSTEVDFLIDDKALEAENITPDEPITFERKGAKLRDIMVQVLEPLQLTYVIEMESIRITSRKTSANAMRFYDLSAILPDNGITNELIAGIENMITPDDWLNAGGTSSLRTIGSMLVVSAPNETQLEVERFLQEISKQPTANLKPRVYIEKATAKPEAEKAVEKPKP